MQFEQHLSVFFRGGKLGKGSPGRKEKGHLGITGLLVDKKDLAVQIDGNGKLSCRPGSGESGKERKLIVGQDIWFQKGTQGKRGFTLSPCASSPTGDQRRVESLQ